MAMFIIFMITEVIRFNSNLGVLPGIVKEEEYLSDKVVYTGILNSYTITYKYDKPFEEYTNFDIPQEEKDSVNKLIERIKARSV